MVVYRRKDYVMGFSALAGASAVIAVSVITENIRPLSVFLIGLLLLFAWIEINAGLEKPEEAEGKDEDSLKKTDSMETELIYRVLQGILFAGSVTMVLGGIITRHGFFFTIGFLCGIILMLSLLGEALFHTYRRGKKRAGIQRQKSI